MSNPDVALANQLKNIETRTGKSLAEFASIIQSCGLAKHGEIRDFLQRELKLGYGDANTLVHHVRKSAGPAATTQAQPLEEVVAGYYSGPKAALRPIHDKLMQAIKTFGEFEIAPKNTYLSLRRKKQFAMIGPATNTLVEVGLNMKGISATDRLIALPPKGMCDFKVRLAGVTEVDAMLIAWIRRAYDSAA